MLEDIILSKRSWQFSGLCLLDGNLIIFLNEREALSKNSIVKYMDVPFQNLLT